MSTLSLNLPELLYKQVCKLAQQDGISLNQFVATAVAEAERSASVERRLA
jgi:predicted HicB family RNase H-like nuclease